MDLFDWVSLIEAKELLHLTQSECIDKIIKIIE